MHSSTCMSTGRSHTVDMGTASGSGITKSWVIDIKRKRTFNEKNQSQSQSQSQLSQSQSRVQTADNEDWLQELIPNKSTHINSSATKTSTSRSTSQTVLSTNKATTLTPAKAVTSVTEFKEATVASRTSSHKVISQVSTSIHSKRKFHHSI